MRIIAGKYRGKKLKEFELSSTKPTLDRVKEAIFSCIQFDIINSTVLDLFSGTGALGIEAVSRGAKNVLFVDKNKEAIKLIKSNLIGIDGEFKVIQSDYEDFLKTNIDKKFDLVLLDPPFNSDFGENAIEFLIANDMIEKNGVIVFERSEEKKFDKTYDSYSIQNKKYGSVGVTIIRKNK